MTYRPNDYPHKHGELPPFDPSKTEHYKQRAKESRQQCEPVSEHLQGKMDDIDCTACSAKDSLDTGLECIECGHDMWIDVYGEPRPSQAPE